MALPGIGPVNAAYLTALLAEPEKILKVIKEELTRLKEKYADPRRTRVIKEKIGQFAEEDLIPKQKTLITITKGGYIKRVPPSTYKVQRRGGKGILGMTKREEDEIENLISTNTHDFILFFTNKGKVFKLRVWEIPEGTRRSKGKAIVNLIDKTPDEKVTSILTYSAKTKPESYILMATKKGRVKKTPLSQFKNIRSSGLIAIKLKREDELRWVNLTSGEDEVILVTAKGKGIRFSEKDVRPMGRDTEGVRGIKLKEDDLVIGMETFPRELKKPKDKRRKFFCDLLTISEKGLGKRTPVSAFPLQKRGGVGVKAALVNQKTGRLVCAKVVTHEIDKIILTSKQGQIIKFSLKGVPVLRRATQGVIMMRFSQEKDKVAAASCLQKREA